MRVRPRAEIAECEMLVSGLAAVLAVVAGVRVVVCMGPTYGSLRSDPDRNSWEDLSVTKTDLRTGTHR